MSCRFYDKSDVKLDVLDFFRGVAVEADQIPTLVFSSIGRTVWRDLGPTAVGFRLLMKLIDFNFLAVVTAVFASSLPDFKRNLAASTLKRD
jgi:hypothetical protein